MLKQRSTSLFSSVRSAALGPSKSPRPIYTLTLSNTINAFNTLQGFSNKEDKTVKYFYGDKPKLKAFFI